MVEQLAVFVGKSPDLVTDEEFRQFFLARHTERRLSRSTATVAIELFVSYWPFAATTSSKPVPVDLPQQRQPCRPILAQPPSSPRPTRHHDWFDNRLYSDLSHAN